MTNLPTPLPSLSSLGWITDSGNKADMLLAHFFESEKSQTFLYGSNVSSLQFIIQQFAGSIDNMLANIKSTLETYLGRYYDLVSATVSSDAATTDQSGSVTITIRCRVSECGNTFDVAKSISVVNSKITKIININNG